MFLLPFLSIGAVPSKSNFLHHSVWHCCRPFLVASGISICSQLPLHPLHAFGESLSSINNGIFVCSKPPSVYQNQGKPTPLPECLHLQPKWMPKLGLEKMVATESLFLFFFLFKLSKTGKCQFMFRTSFQTPAHTVAPMLTAAVTVVEVSEGSNSSRITTPGADSTEDGLCKSAGCQQKRQVYMNDDIWGGSRLSIKKTPTPDEWQQ